MHLRSLLYLVAAQACVSSARTIDHWKRATATDATLYAYGNSTSGWPIAYDTVDGLLYVTQTPNNSSVNLVSITWEIASVTSSTRLANASFANGTSAGSLYIIKDENESVGLLPTTEVAQDNGTTSGFALFASQLVYYNDSNLEAQFWAKSSNTSGIYSLTWISSDASSGDGFPVVIKAS